MVCHRFDLYPSVGLSVEHDKIVRSTRSTVPVVYQSVCNLLLLEMRAKRLYLRPSYLIGLDWIGLMHFQSGQVGREIVFDILVRPEPV